MDDRLDILRRAPVSGAPPLPGAMPPWEIRYTLEAPDAAAAAALPGRLAALLGEAAQVTPLFRGAGAELARFALLAFPGSDRRQATRAASFEAGYALTEALGLVSAEPDLGADHFPEPAPAGDAVVTESVTDLSFWCWVDQLAPPDRHWALDAMRVRAAWAISPARGAGIRIAQPDTGIADHAELARARVRADLGIDLVDGQVGPLDPLLPSAGNPGHGTGTASVAVSGPGGAIIGSAPGAELVPIRCIESVSVFDQSRVARAVEHARAAQADVVTMSLGGVPGRALEAALGHGVEDGLIVLAAAGNCVGLVVYPARYRRCIAIGAVNSAGLPWRGSCSGSAVAVCAPGELVWRARRRGAADATHDEVEGGQGTSFATALTAGVAALWLAHHGREAVRAMAKARATTVQELFRAALTATARVPPDWDSGRYGAGIVDAEALLRLALADIAAAATEGAAESDEAALRALLSEAVPDGRAEGVAAAAGPALRRFGPEIAALAFDAARAGAVLKLAPLMEAPSAQVELPSPSLAALLRVPPAPALRLGRASLPAVRGRSASAYLGMLGRRRGPLEAAAAAPARRELLDRLVRALEATDRGKPPADAETLTLRRQLLDDAERVLARAAQEEPGAIRLDRRSTTALEALVRTSARPALLVCDGGWDSNDPELDATWQEALFRTEPAMRALIRSTGRVELEGMNAGTGFVVAPGVVMTNRHVLEGIATPPATPGESWTMLGEVAVNFCGEARSDQRSAFRVTGVAFAGPAPIGRVVDLRRLDLALLTVATQDQGGAALPPPLPLVSEAAAAGGARNLAIIGYPAQPRALPRGSDGRIDPEVLAALQRIFRTEWDVKRLALGRVDRGLGRLPRDTAPPWAFGHDATTLGGNSGSAIGLLESTDDDAPRVLGLHVGGQWLEQNYAHVLAAVPALRAVGGLTWVAP